MTDKTAQHLIYRAMTELGLLNGGEAPSSDDYNTMDGLIDPLIEQLSGEEVIYIDDRNAIAPAYFLSLARLLAVVAAGTFGNAATENLLTNTRAGNVDSLQEREKTLLRKITSGRPTYAPLTPDYY